MKRILISIGLAAAIAVTAFAAGCSEGKNLVKLSYYDETSYTEGGTLSTINENLFYRNDRKVDVADPCVVCVEDADDPDFGSYFLYGTTGNTGFFCWKSNDLVNWEGVGYAFLYRDLTTPEGSAVSMDSWAPEVVYDAEEGKWYLFFSASPADTAYTYIPYVAESDSPRGPFTLVDHIETYRAPDGTPLKDIADIEENNEYYFQRYMTFDPYLMADAMEQAGIAGLDDTSSLLRAIDFHPYVDEKTDEKYLYFNTSAGSYIMGMRMKNWLEPDYDSLTILTKPGYSTPSSAERDVAHEANTSVNEAAWMTEHSGKYYLTYSVNSYQDKTYQVCQAVGDSPLGEFRKLSEAEGGILLSADASLRDDVSGTGHSTILTAGGNDYIVYHAHNSVAAGGSSRHVAIDEIKWITIEDEEGNALDIMYANGPTTGVQPLPEFASGYANIAPEAEVSATALAEGSSASYLTDGLLSVNRYANYDMVERYVREAEFGEETTITLKFDGYRAMRALMIYNSKNMDSAFFDITRIEFDCRREDGSLVTKYIDNLAFDWQAYTSVDDVDVIRPAAAAIAEFDEMECDEIRITVTPATQEQIPVHGLNGLAELALSEIRVLGK